MLAQIITENGVKKLKPLTADAGAGAPVGTIIVVCSNRVPSNYLPLGTQYDTSLYPVLYALLGTDTTPTASALGLPTLTSGQYAIKATSGLTENQQENVLNTINDNLSYSTTEHATGKKWIDGKPIYRKVIENLSVGQTDVSSLNIDMVISLTGLTFDANVNYLSFPYYDSAHGFIRNLYYSTTTKNIFYQAEGGSNTKTWAFIEYTKTTD